MTKAHPLIAVIDDEEPVRTALMRLMRSAGLTVETFGSGAEFLKSLETRLPDCVVLDLHMPHMDGFNVQAHLARKCAALPVIIVTGHDFPKARERAMAGGASAFLRKPVHDRTLLDAISAATDLRYQMRLFPKLRPAVSAAPTGNGNGMSMRPASGRQCSFVPVPALTSLHFSPGHQQGAAVSDRRFCTQGAAVSPWRAVTLRRRQTAVSGSTSFQ